METRTGRTGLLKDEDASYYQQQIGVLRWMVELGRVDILTEVSMLAAYSTAPRLGHLAAVLHLYAYIKSHNRSKLVFDPTKADHDPHPKHDWADFYKSSEVIPADRPLTDQRNARRASRPHALWSLIMPVSYTHLTLPTILLV